MYQHHMYMCTKVVLFQKYHISNVWLPIVKDSLVSCTLFSDIVMFHWMSIREPISDALFEISLVWNLAGYTVDKCSSNYLYWNRYLISL